VISVVLCTYNGRAFVEEQLESILTQSRAPDEVLVFDDGSTDGTQALVQAWGDRHLQIQFHQNPVRLGYARNFEQALLKSRGTWVFLSDQDDRWYPKRVETLLQNAGNAHLVYGDARIWHPEQSSTETLFTQFPKRRRTPTDSEVGEALRKPGVKGCQMAVRRSLIEACFPAPAAALERWGHDHWLWVHALALGSIRSVDQVLMDHRIHSANTSGRIRTSWIRLGQRKWKDLLGQEPGFWLQRYASLRPWLKHPEANAAWKGALTQQLAFEEARERAVAHRDIRGWWQLVSKSQYAQFSFGYSAALGDLWRMFGNRTSNPVA